MTAMVATSARSSVRRSENRLVAASTRSPPGERLSTSAACSVPGGRSGAEGEQRLARIDAVDLQAEAARAAHSARSSMPGAIGASGSIAPAAHRPSVAPSTRFDLLARQRRRAAAAAGRSRQATMVDSTPTGVGPPSTMRSMRPPRSSSTCARGGRRDVAGAVGGWRHHRPAEPRAGGRAPPDAAGTRTAMLSSPAVASSATGQPARFFSTSVSGPGQNAAASFSAAASNTARRSRGREIEHMRDQRIERRPALGGVEPRDRRAVGGVGAEAVDRLGRERDQPAGGEAARRVGDGDEVGGKRRGCRSCGHFFFRFCACLRRARRLADRRLAADLDPVEIAFVFDVLRSARTAAPSPSRSQCRVSSRNFSRISARSSG